MWEHLAKLIEYNQLSVWKILPKEKVDKILSQINTSYAKLKDVKERQNEFTTTFDEIDCVLAHFKNKSRKTK